MEKDTENEMESGRSCSSLKWFVFFLVLRKQDGSCALVGISLKSMLKAACATSPDMGASRLNGLAAFGSFPK